MNHAGLPTAVRARLRRGVSAHALAQAVGIAAQLLLVPVFLWHWGAARYGEWLLMSALPSALALADIGITTALANELVRLVATGHLAEATLRVRAAWGWVALLGSVGLVVAAALGSAAGLQVLFGLDPARAGELARAVRWLLLHGVLIVLTGLVLAPMNAVGQHARGVHLGTALRMAELLATVLAVQMGADAATLAATLALTRGAGLLAVALDVRRHVPWLPSAPSARLAWEHRALLGSGLAFLSFPFGNLLMNQGVLAAIGLGLDAVAVAQVAVLRSAARLLPQLAKVFLQAAEPELAMAHAGGDPALMRALSRRAGATAWWIGLPGAAALAIAGPALIGAWTGRTLAVDPGLAAAIAFTGLLNGLWLAPLGMLTSTNRHVRAGLGYGVVAAVVALGSGPVIHALGLAGLGLWLVLGEAVLVATMVRLGCTVSADRPLVYLAACVWPGSAAHGASPPRRPEGEHRAAAHDGAPASPLPEHGGPERPR